jgi:hypothetical protein
MLSAPSPSAQAGSTGSLRNDQAGLSIYSFSPSSGGFTGSQFLICD